MKKSKKYYSTKKKGKGWRESKDSSGVAPNHSQARKYGYSSHARETAYRMAKNPKDTADNIEKHVNIYRQDEDKYIVYDDEGNYKQMDKEELYKDFTSEEIDSLDKLSEKTGHIILTFIPGGRVTAAAVEKTTGVDPIKGSVENAPRNVLKSDLSKGEKTKRVVLGMATGGASGLYYAIRDKKKKS